MFFSSGLFRLYFGFHLKRGFANDYLTHTVAGSLPPNCNNYDKIEAYIEYNVYNLIRESELFLTLFNNSFAKNSTNNSYNYFLELEYGIPLKEYLEKFSPSSESVISCYINLLDEIHFLNQSGVYYTDIKPDNVVVIRDKFYLIDFGRCVSKEGVGISHGAYAFIAPEVYHGKKAHREKSNILNSPVVVLDAQWLHISLFKQNL